MKENKTIPPFSTNSEKAFFCEWEPQTIKVRRKVNESIFHPATIKTINIFKIH